MSKYRFSLSPKIKGYVEWQLEHYHEDKKQLEEFRSDMIPNATPSYSLAGGVQGGKISSTTENAAIRLATNPYILTTERSVNAIEKMLEYCDDTDKKLISLVYWKRSHTVEGAGMVVFLSRRQAYRRINKIQCILALELGLVNI